MEEGAPDKLETFALAVAAGAVTAATLAVGATFVVKVALPCPAVVALVAFSWAGAASAEETAMAPTATDAKRMLKTVCSVRKKVSRVTVDTRQKGLRLMNTVGVGSFSRYPVVQGVLQE